MKKRTKIILAVLALLIIAGIIATVANKGKNEVINFQTTQVEPGDISTTITCQDRRCGHPGVGYRQAAVCGL